MTPARPRLLFVTGKLAEPALRRMLADLAPKVGFEPEVAVLNITVAALMTANWVARHLSAPVTAERVILPGLCRGDVEEVARAAGVPTELGPKDLLDLPEFFGKSSGPPPGYGGSTSRFSRRSTTRRRNARGDPRGARHYRDSGADVIDLGCDPGGRGPASRTRCGCARRRASRVDRQL